MHSTSTDNKICVVGLGYIGLPTAVLAAQHGCHVDGYDVDIQKVTQINKAIAPIVEPEIEERLAAVVKEGTLKAHTELPESSCYVVAVPTPFKEGRKADLTYIFNAGTAIARVMKPGTLIILESTIPVGTTKRFAQLLEDLSGLDVGQDFFVAHCPERVLPGKIFYELVHNDRVVGGLSEQATQRAKQFYEQFVSGTIYTTTAATAEMVKLVENSSRDVQIAFANQLAAMCEQADIEVQEVIELANKHPRVNLLQPGCGVGGHCIAVDPWFLIETFPNDSTLIKTARMVNDAKPHKVIEKVVESVQALRENKPRNYKPKVLLLGLTFKPNIDDLRESPALMIAQELATKLSVMDLAVCEPHVNEKELAARNVGTKVSLSDGLNTAEIVVILVKHDQFKQIVLGELYEKNVIDTCGLMYDLQQRQNVSSQNASTMRA